MIRKRLALASGLGVVMMLATPGAAFAAPPAGAAGPPKGGCPHGGSWELAVPQEGHLAAQYDFNRDTYVCGYFSPGGGFAVMDNVVR